MLPSPLPFYARTRFRNPQTTDKMSTIINNPDNTKTTATTGQTRTYDFANGTRNKNLQFVDDLAKFQVHHDDVDIRDFDVRLMDGTKIGEVEGLLADVPSRLVRYAEVEIEDDVINRYTGGHYAKDDKHVLVPIGLVQINADKTVTIHGIGLDQMIDYPRYNRKFGYTTDYELATNRYLGGFHEYSTDSFRDRINDRRFDTKTNAFDDTFYSGSFYESRKR